MPSTRLAPLLLAFAAVLLARRPAFAACDVDSAGAPCEDDGNPCSLDVCDDAGTCTHPTGGNAACDDGDPCTIDDVCADGVCAGTVVSASCIDAAPCYRTHGEDGFARIPARFDDPETLATGSVARPRDLCVPARTQLAGRQAILPADIAPLLAWVHGGGSLLLSIDHSPRTTWWKTC